MYKQKIKISEHLLITLLSPTGWIWVSGLEPLHERKIDKIEMVQRRAARWVSNDYSTYSSVTEMMSNLGWWSLENRCYDAHLLMFYKIVYGLVAIPVLSYFEHLEVYTRHTNPLAYIQIHTSVCYYQYSFFPTGRGSSIGSEFAWHASGPEFDPRVRHILSWRLGHENISTAILPLPLIQEERLSVTDERMCTKYWQTA